MLSSAACLLLFSTLAGGSTPPSTAEVAARVDTLVAADWKKQGVSAEPRADEATFLRRVWLDLGGGVPPPLKARAFLDDASPNKRGRLVETLLASDDFADHWGRTWAAALTGRRPFLQDTYDGRVLHEYLHDALKDGKSYRQIVVELISGSGLTDVSGPANFLARYDAKPVNLAGAVSKQFLGITLECAQCHDHPFAPWKQEDFWGVAAYFGRVRVLENTNNEDGSLLRAVLDARRGELLVPDTAAEPDEEGNLPKKIVKPRTPLGKPPTGAGERRRQLADWVTADDNPFFARHAVNRVWGQLFGTPLVKSLEAAPGQTNVRNQLLELLAVDFSASGYDVKRLVHIIVDTTLYQLGSGKQATAASPFEARFPVRPLSVDQLYHSIVQATGCRGDEDAEAQAKPEEEEPAEPDRPVEFLSERSLSLQRTLSLLNGDYVHRAVRAGAAAAIAANGKHMGTDHLEWLFLATLARRPTAEEAKELGELLQAGKGRRGLEDVLWILVNSAEFGTNH